MASQWLLLSKELHGEGMKLTSKGESMGSYCQVDHFFIRQKGTQICCWHLVWWSGIIIWFKVPVKQARFAITWAPLSFDACLKILIKFEYCTIKTRQVISKSLTLWFQISDYLMSQMMHQNYPYSLTILPCVGWLKQKWYIQHEALPIIEEVICYQDCFSKSQTNINVIGSLVYKMA